MKLFHYEVGGGSWRALCLLILGVMRGSGRAPLFGSLYLPGPTPPFGGPRRATYLASVLMAAFKGVPRVTYASPFLFSHSLRPL